MGRISTPADQARCEDGGQLIAIEFKTCMDACCCKMLFDAVYEAPWNMATYLLVQEYLRPSVLRKEMGRQHSTHHSQSKLFP